MNVAHQQEVWCTVGVPLLLVVDVCRVCVGDAMLLMMHQGTETQESAGPSVTSCVHEIKMPCKHAFLMYNVMHRLPNMIKC